MQNQSAFLAFATDPLMTLSPPCCLKINKICDTFTPQVWPGEAVYPDYLAAPKIDTWIKSQLQRFYDEVPFDGLWLDMNEAANFCSGRLCKSDPKNTTSMHCKRT
jgi:alpha-glucosidase (family GH31 glycosyl hydrolase)